MLTQHIALVPETADAWQANLRASTTELLRVSAALQRQVSHDLGPLWGVQATVNAFAALEEVPVGYWPIVVRFGDLGSDAGVHLDENGQPYARVAQGPLWSLAASRACLEMLVNPFGDRCVSAASPRSGQGAVEVLVEVSGPCASPSLAYPIDGVMVSDFCLPAFYTASARDSRERLSFRHALRTPFGPAAGGHLTWFDPYSNLWWLRSLTADGATDTNLGPVDRRLTSARTLVRQHLAALASASMPAHVEHDARSALEHAKGAARARASRLRTLLGASVPPPVNESDEVDEIDEELLEEVDALHEAASHHAVEAGGCTPQQSHDAPLPLVEASDLAATTSFPLVDTRPIKRASVEPRGEVSQTETAGAAQVPVEAGCPAHAQNVEVLQESIPEARDSGWSDDDDFYGDDEDPEANMTEADVAGAVASVSYDSASDVLTQSAPPPLPASTAAAAPTRSVDTKPPVQPLPSMPAPAKTRPGAAQLSSLSERDEPSRRGTWVVGLAAAAVLGGIWLSSDFGKPQPKPKAQPSAQAKPAKAAPAPVVAAVPAPDAAVAAAAAQPSELTPAAMPAPPVEAPLAEKAKLAAAPTPIADGAAPPSPPKESALQAKAPEPAKPQPTSEHRRARRERPVTAQAEPAAPAQAAPAQAAPVPAAPAPAVAAPAAPAPASVPRQVRPTATAHAAELNASGDGLDDLIESRH